MKSENWFLITFFFFQVGETIRMEALIYILEFKKIIS